MTAQPLHGMHAVLMDQALLRASPVICLGFREHLYIIQGQWPSWFPPLPPLVGETGS